MDFGGSNVSQAITRYIGPRCPKVVFVTGTPYWDGKPLSEAGYRLVSDLARRAGITWQDCGLLSVLGEIAPAREEYNLGADRRSHWESDAREFLERLRPTLLVPLGNYALATLTGYSSIDKWHLSIIPARSLPSMTKTVPLFHPDRINASYGEIPFLIFGMQRIKEEMDFPEIRVVPRVYHTAPTFEQATSFLGQCMFAEDLSIDIETANGQITCIGFSFNPREAMCIPTLPENWSPAEFHKLWVWVSDVISGPSRKVFQNYLYDCSYFSKYGITVRNLWHDTMHAQKFLHPELPKGLDTIARLYTREPYWKDEGKDWKCVQDLNQFWLYNCKDVSLTLEAAYEQRRDLVLRGLESKFHDLVMEMAPHAAEMSWRGLPVDSAKREAVRLELDGEIAKLGGRLNEIAAPFLGGKEFNPRSHIQVKELLKRKGYRIPVKHGKETSDVTALLKLSQKYPNDEGLKILIELSEKNKRVSSYLKPSPYADGRHRYSLDIHGTEPGRWSCSKDPWGNGLNAQTIPSAVKKMYQAPPGWKVFEADLKQADARVVAWEAPEPKLIDFFRRGVDIHRYVAGRPELFNKAHALETVTKDERQLGKKTGHAANYGMMGATLADSCLLEMGLFLSARRADQMLEGYHREFPGIRMRQQKIQMELRKCKKLVTPLGRERYFYGRLDDATFREAYAYTPPSTVVDIINKLIRHVAKNRNPEKCHAVNQVHDSGLWLIAEDYEEEMLQIVKAQSDWNPTLSLPGGDLVIPVEVKLGDNWGELKETAL